jgi:hypothetical protein
MRYVVYQTMVVLGVIWAVDTLAFQGRYTEPVFRGLRQVGEVAEALYLHLRQGANG